MADPPPSTSRHPLALDCMIAGSDIYIPLEPLAAPDRAFFTAGTGALVDASLTARLPAVLFCALSDAGYTQVDIGAATVAMSITAVTKPVPPEVALSAIGLPIPLIDTALACGGSLGAEIPLDFPPVTSIPWSDGGYTVDYLLTVGGIDFALTNLAPSGADLSLTDLCQPADRSVPVNGTTDDPEDSPRIAADKNGDGNYEAAATAQDQIQLPVNGWCAGYKCDDFNDCTIDTCLARAQWCTWANEPDGTSCLYGEDPGQCIAGVCHPPFPFPCTEQGILDAIAAGGGPHTFACNGPTTLSVAEIVIDNDVILDGQGNLTLSANGTRVVSVLPGTRVELLGMTITGGSLYGAVRGGAGILNDGILTLTQCRVISNQCNDVDGGGILNTASLTVIDSIVAENTVWWRSGGGITSIGSLTLRRTEVTGNRAASASAISGSAVLIDSEISGNSYWRPSGPMYAGSTIDGAVVAIGSTFSGNSAGWGPMMRDATLTNCTVSDNSAATAVSSGTLINSTLIAGPTTHPSGIDTLFGGGTVTNSILVDPNAAFSPVCGASVVSGGGNIESPGDTCGFTDPTDQVNVSVAALSLGPLQYNGGPTMTHAPGASSVAIDQIPAAMCVDAGGQPLTTDQRGAARPQGAMCDVGAFEVQQ